MASKKDGKGSSTGGLTALKIGTRVRCTDDGVQGRITWANGSAVKVQWDDGEQVTWRRDTLASRPIDVLPSVSGDEVSVPTPEPADPGQGVATPEPANEKQGVATALPRAETATAQAAAAESAPQPDLPLVEKAASAVELAAEPASSASATAQGQPAPATPEAVAETLAPSKRRRKTSAAPKEKKLSALDAAAKVLAEAGQHMTCLDMIAAMAEKGYWTSPGGKTPAATLCSAMLREITTQGSRSRFVKVERGKFGRSGVA
jgi:hypothetical protein